MASNDSDTNGRSPSPGAEPNPSPSPRDDDTTVKKDKTSTKKAEPSSDTEMAEPTIEPSDIIPTLKSSESQRNKSPPQTAAAAASEGLEEPQKRSRGVGSRADNDSARDNPATALDKPAKSAGTNNTESSGSHRELAARSSEAHAAPDTTPASSRRHHNTIGSVFSGNKIRHLKKDDGIPLWRKDIQYEFLKRVFEDDTPCFTRFPDGKKGFTFADIYIDAMAKSSKTSKVLKEKLHVDRPAAIHMAMVCLLVNFGRMNTTLNFFPEMRAQLRTYHSIPSLQAQQDPNAYKQLQDAPRLKSILKGASEDVEQPGTIDKIKNHPVPRSNPVNLIFVLSQYAPKISELHFPPPGDFFDLVMRPTLSSESRAKAFLWLMYYYLEGDFSDDAAKGNPFGPGTVGEGSEGRPLKVPEMRMLSDQEAELENLDTPEEIRFGEEKQRERKRILEDDEIIFRHVKRPRRDYPSDDQASEEPTRASQRDRNRRRDGTPLNPAKRALEDEDVGEPYTGSRSRSKRPKRDSSANRPPGSHPQRLVLKTRMDQTPDTSSPAPPGSSHPVLSQYPGNAGSNGAGAGSRRPRPMTQHQIALEHNRKQRVEYALAQRRGEVWNSFRLQREAEGPFARAARLIQNLPTGYDTDDENSWGMGGICPGADEEDYGEASNHYLSAVRKVARRLQRWDWDSVLAGDKDSNGLGNEYNRPFISEHRDLEVISQATPSASKSKSRSAARRDRRAAEETLDRSRDNKKSASRGGASSRRKTGHDKTPTSGRNRQRPRTSKGTSKPATSPDTQIDVADLPTISEPKDTHMLEDNFEDDLEKEVFEGDSPHDIRSRLDDASSIGIGPENLPDDGGDTEEMSDGDMELSKLTDIGYDRESMSQDNDHDIDAGQLDEDESMLQA